MCFFMNEIVIGEEFPKSSEAIKSRLSFSLFSSDIFQRWSRCGITADYIAAFFSYSMTSDTRKNSEVFFSISVITQELIKNALRHSRTKKEEIFLSFCEFPQGLEIEIENPVSREQFYFYQEEVQKLQAIKEYKAEYLRRIQARVEFSHKKSEGIGLLNLLQRFPIKFSFCFWEAENEVYRVKTRVFLSF